MKKNKTGSIFFKLTFFVFALAVIMGAMFAAPAAVTAEGLPSNENQKKQAEAFGLPTTQPDRQDPNGDKVDKTKSPLGVDALVFNKIYQLAYAQKERAGNKQFVYDYSSQVGYANKSPMANSPVTGENWNVDFRKLVPADVNGDLLQEVVTIGLVRGVKGVSIMLFVSDYNDIKLLNSQRRPTSSPTYTIPTKEQYPLYPENTDNPYGGEAIKAAAGDFDRDGREEVAISVGNSLYVVEVTMERMDILSSVEYPSGLHNTRIGDVEAADVNKDNFPELLVTKESDIIADLLIFEGTALDNPDQTILLTDIEKDTDDDGKGVFTQADVYTGDIFGEGEDVIVIGGIANYESPALSYIRYDPQTDSYSTILPKIYTLESDSTPISPAVKSRLDVKTVSLSEPVPGTPDTVVLGGQLYKYDTDTDAFERLAISSSVNDSKLKPNAGNISLDNITNVNSKKDETYILDTLVGNFDGNKDGKEQIFMLHVNKWRGKEYVYLTEVKENSNGNLWSDLTEQWKEGEGDFIYPAIAAPYILDKGVKVEFLPDKSEFMFSNPVITAVLGASPYYKELEGKNYALAAAATTYGSTTEEGSSKSHGFVAEVGVSFGYSWDFNLFGLMKTQAQWEATVTNSFSSNWMTGKSISKSFSYTSYIDDDAVVVMVVPYDIYHYKVSTRDKNGQIRVEEMTVEVPYEPVTTMMPVARYNEVAANIDNVPVIDRSKVLQHTVGDPRSYPRTAAGLSNVEGNDVLLAGASEDESFTGCGIGSSSVEQSISSAYTSGREFDYQLTVGLNFNANIMGVLMGASTSAGYTRNVTITSSETTTRTGSVASVPEGYERYQFEWALAVYNYEVQASDGSQTFPVINYLVRPIGEFPPTVPEKPEVKQRSLNGITIEWNQADLATDYTVYRSTSPPDDDLLDYDKEWTLAGKSSTTFTDTDIEPGQTYYYQVLARNAKDAVPTEPLEVESLFVKEVRITRQPKLTYEEGEALDLSQLEISLEISDDTTENVKFADFQEKNITKNITTSLPHGKILEPTEYRNSRHREIFGLYIC